MFIIILFVHFWKGKTGWTIIDGNRLNLNTLKVKVSQEQQEPILYDMEDDGDSYS